jgi:CRISPR/Cas system CSM-associated protein Csm5 (group 7 of RAMP superfamily)
MNQVMINAVDLEMLVQEIKDLKVKIAELNKMLADERGRNKVPEREWVGLTMTKIHELVYVEEFVLGMSFEPRL